MRQRYENHCCCTSKNIGHSNGLLQINPVFSHRPLPSPVRPKEVWRIFASDAEYPGAPARSAIERRTIGAAARLAGGGTNRLKAEGPLWDEDSAAELVVREFGLELDLDLREAVMTYLICPTEAETIS